MISNFVQLGDGSVSADVSWNQTGNDVMSFIVSYSYSGNDVSHTISNQKKSIFDLNKTWSSVKASSTVVALLNIPLGVQLSVRVLAVNPRGNSEFSPNTTATTAVTPGAMLRPTVASFDVQGSTTRVYPF